MSVAEVRELLGWCAIINLAMITWWFLMIVYAGNLIYKIHTKWFYISRDTFTVIHYAGIGLYKILVFTFIVVPYLALVIAG